MHFNFNIKFAFLFSWTIFVLVLLLSPLPFNGASDEITFVDKIVHAFLFGILAFLTFYWLRDENEEIVLNPKKTTEKKKKNVRKKNNYIKVGALLQIFLFVFSTTTSMAILLEYLQLYVPGRSVDVYDFVSGLIGIVLVLIFIYGDNYSRKKT